MKDNSNSTIAAIVTGMSKSGVGIIRISGDDAIAVAEKVFIDKNNQRKLSTYKANTIHYGYIENDGTLIDEVLVSVFKKPFSYTKEDIVEINCHGGIYVVTKVLELILHSGAEMAEPGEFTKRAFLNGRIDLSKAEAVMDIINSENEFALKSSMNQLNGSLYKVIKELRDKILYEIAFIESALDDPEHISLDGYPEKLEEKTNTLICKIEELLVTSKNGKILKEGINTVIVGKPNAGKSSLLNRMVGEEKAIVTEIPGTTRDIIEEHIHFGDISLNIIDTAGIRDTDDRIEKIGVEKAIQFTEKADLIIYVIDSSTPLDDNDNKIISMLENKKVIVLLNKSDLSTETDEKEIQKRFHEASKIIRTSVTMNSGLLELQDTIHKMFYSGEIEENKEVYITNLRHIEALENTLQSLQMVIRSIEQNMPEDFFSIDLMSAYTMLGLIIGEEVEEDLVNEIFSKFCTGK